MTAEPAKPRHRSAEERRLEIQANAARLGIDDAFISTLVEAFYQRIRSDERIAFLFEDAIQDWGPHLETMKRFWRSVALNTGEYSGKPVPKHQALVLTQPEHFQVWLDLFEQTLKAIAPNEEVVAYFLERAQRIAHSLELAMFGLPGLSVKDR